MLRRGWGWRAGQHVQHMQHLGHNLAGVQMAHKAHLPGGAEDAAHGAAGLGADAGCETLPVGHDDRFDALAVGQAQQEFARAILALLFGQHGQTTQAGVACQPCLQVGA